MVPDREEEDPFLLAAAVGLTTATERPGRPVVARPVEPVGDLTELGVPTATGPTGASTSAAPALEPARRRRRWPWLVAIGVVVAALLAAGAVWAVSAKVFTPSTPVPKLVGRTVASATSVADASHLDVRVSGRTTSITVPAGVVISQQPAARSGTSVKQGSTISLVVSTGLPLVAVPPVASFSNCHDAVAALAAVHLVGTCPPVAAVYSSSVAAGAVIGTTPKGQAPYGSSVTVITSKGHAPVAAPTVTGTGIDLRLGRRRADAPGLRSRPGQRTTRRRSRRAR